MTREEFEKLTEEGFGRLPEWVREKIKNVALLVENDPSEEVRVREGLSEGETLLGYYQGVPLSERGEMYGVGMTLPDTVTLYINPILTAAEEDGLPVVQVIAETIWHEYAHHFGMDEEEVQAREKGRDDMV
jgi:predicted Zn-dependent protease with MMP-like domain